MWFSPITYKNAYISAYMVSFTCRVILFIAFSQVCVCHTEISLCFSIVFMMVLNIRISSCVVPMMRLVHICWHSAPVETEYCCMVQHWHAYFHRFVYWTESGNLSILHCSDCFVGIRLISSKANIRYFHFWSVARKRNLLVAVEE